MSDSIRHPSYGMVSISHTNSTGTYLAGSEFKHQHFVALKICRGSVERSALAAVTDGEQCENG